MWGDVAHLNLFGARPSIQQAEIDGLEFKNTIPELCIMPTSQLVNFKHYPGNNSTISYLHQFYTLQTILMIIFNE